MKKQLITAFLLLCTVLIFLISCGDGNNPEKTYGNETTINTEKPDKKDKKEDPSLSLLRKEISDNGAVLGVAYLGYHDGEFPAIKDRLDEMGVTDLYPFIKDIYLYDYFKLESNELYLIVPSDEQSVVEIYSAVPDESSYELKKGKLIGKSENGKPFLLNCNVSEIVPNVIISTQGFDYSPRLSGMDGRVVTTDSIYDFSPYDNITDYFGNRISDGASGAFCGLWLGEVEDENGLVNTLLLSLYEDGTAEYIYGIGNSEPTEGFEGEWSYDPQSDLILLDMSGGAFDDTEGSENKYIDPYKLECGFEWYVDYRDDGASLVLTHKKGDTILFGKDSATFELCHMNIPMEEEYSYLIGSWGIISEIKETYLEIFENGDARYYVVNEGVTEKDFYGTWYADQLTLHLNLYEYREDGAAIDEPAVFFGDYGISYDGELLTLSLIDDNTDPLTAFMAENGYDSFILYGVG